MIFELLHQKKLILVCGSGGVGKTTIAASFALQGALIGKKTIVLTIDPAKRLATSLGLESLTGEPRKINLNSFGPKGEGELWAMMLDAKRTFDQLIIKYSPSKEIEKRILSNKIYQHLSNMIAGSQEYMAMEKLYEFFVENQYDLIVIDTPPTTHAIDFLAAPQKMIDALGHSMIHLLVKPALKMGKGGLKLFEKGSRMILKIFDRITGFAFLQDISEMLIAFKELLGGFESRAGEVKEILSSGEAAFVLVTTPEEKSVKEATYFIEELKERGLPFAGIIFNRVSPYYNLSSSQKEADRKQITQLFGEETAEKMVHCFGQSQILGKKDKECQDRLTGLVSKGEFILSLPLFESDIHDLKGLQACLKFLR